MRDIANICSLRRSILYFTRY